jgi:hypothetical protein
LDSSSPAYRDGAFLCWSGGDGHVKIRYFTYEGEERFGETIDLGPGDKCAIAADDEYNLHIVYHNSGIRYRKLTTF